MKLTAMVVLSGSAVLPTLGQTPTQIWARQFGTPADDAVVGSASDGAGGVLVAGYTEGDLGAPNAGSADVFLARYDAAGNQLWVRQFGTSTFDQARDVAHAVGGFSYLLGTTGGSLGGPNLGSTDSFVAVYDGAGAPLLLRQFGTSGGDFAKGIAANGSTAIIVGNTTGVIGAGGGGGNDPFIGKFDAATNTFLWVRQFGSPGTENAYSVALDGSGGGFIGGFTDGNMAGVNAGAYDAFIARYDSAGNQLWLDQLGSASTDMPGQIALDGAGGVVMSGRTGGDLAGVNEGSYDIFLARYDGAGNQLWIRQFGTSADDSGGSMAPAGLGQMWFVGSSSGSLWSTGVGGYDALLARFDAVGNALIWGHQFGTAADEGTAGVVAGLAGPAYVTGTTDGALASTAAGGSDAYIVKFGSCYADCNNSGTLTIADFGCFQSKFANADMYADCNGSGTLTIADFGCFQSQFASGCP
jgi:hypothetical protein